MPIRAPSIVLAVVLAASLASCAKPHAPAAPRAEVPAALALPDGEEAALRLDARGTQNYECRAKRDAPDQTEWALVAPEAELFDSSGKKVGMHYAGPTWESIGDGSKVVGTVKARADAPAPDAIPWLLLAATESSADGMLGRVKSIQRTDTRGGKPPAGTCAAGEALTVPYSAVYWFSRARR
jgi:hypothetical protein